MLIVTLCGSYKTEVAALSKLNLARKILAHVSRRLLSKQVLCKPFGRWSGGGFEILHVGVKMATGQRHETLRLKRPLIGSQGQVSDREDITKRNHHHQRRRPMRELSPLSPRRTCACRFDTLLCRLLTRQRGLASYWRRRWLLQGARE